MRNLLDAIELADLVKCINTGREATMETENLVLHHCGERQVVEKLCEDLPNVGVTVLAQAFIIEPIPTSRVSQAEEGCTILTLG